MDLRRNPQRGCKKKIPPSCVALETRITNLNTRKSTDDAEEDHKTRKLYRKDYLTTTRRRKPNTNSQRLPQPGNNNPFPFFELPRELRDHVYSYLTIRGTHPGRPVLEAASILRDRKKRITAQANQARLNRRRLLAGRTLICARPSTSEPILHLNLLQASKQLSSEASECLYGNNWFAISLSKLPTTIFETPFGWDLSRITRLQVELQLKDAARMNSYLDWTNFFALFSSLRVLRIIPTFHPRYYYWAHAELRDWSTAHFVHKAFFRELLCAIPKNVNLEIRSSKEAATDMEVQGRNMDRKFLLEMYTELGTLLASMGRTPSW